MAFEEKWESATYTLIVTGTGESVGPLTTYKTQAKIIEIRSPFKIVANYCFQDFTALTKITFPESLESIGNDIIGGTPLKEIHIPKNVNSLSPRQSFDKLTTLENIFVDKENKYFCDIDGVIFTKDLKVIYHIPGAKRHTIYFIPDTVRTIALGCISSSQYLTQVIIPPSVTEIQSYFGFDSPQLNNIVINQCKRLVSFDSESAFAGTQYSTNWESIMHYHPTKCFIKKTLQQFSFSIEQFRTLSLLMILNI